MFLINKTIRLLSTLLLTHSSGLFYLIRRVAIPGTSVMKGYKNRKQQEQTKSVLSA